MLTMSTGAPHDVVPSDASPPQATEPVRRPPPRRLAVLLAVLLLGGWTTWAVDAYRTQLRGVSQAELRADLASGAVRDYFLVSDLSDKRDAWARAGLGTIISGTAAITDGGLPEQRGRDVVAVAYHVDSWDRPTRLVMIPVEDIGGATVHDPARVVEQFRAAGVRAQGEPGAPDVDRPSWNIAETAALGTLLAMLAVILSIRTRRGTAWFWLWTAWLPFGLGVVLFALSELAFPPRQPAERRRPGWLSFLVVLLTGGFRA